MQAAAPKKAAAPKAKKTITKKVGLCILWSPALCCHALLWLLQYSASDCHSTLFPTPIPHCKQGLSLTSVLYATSA